MLSAADQSVLLREVVVQLVVEQRRLARWRSPRAPSRTRRSRSSRRRSCRRVRPSANTSIFAPARCGVDPLRAHDRHQRDGFAALRARPPRRQALLRSDEHLDLRLLLQRLDEGVGVLLLLLLGQELLDPARSTSSNGTVAPGLWSVTLMMW